MEPSPHVDVEAEARRLIESLHVELAFADLVRPVAADDHPAPSAVASAPVPQAVPLGLLRTTAVVAGAVGVTLVVAGFVLHAVAGLLGLFLLPAFVLLSVLAVEQSVHRLR